jgi:hypothetical protein
LQKSRSSPTSHDAPSLLVTDKRQPRSREREGLWWNGRTIKELLPLSSAAGAPRAQVNITTRGVRVFELGNLDAPSAMHLMKGTSRF